MFEELPFMLLFLLISIILSHLLLNYTPGALNKLFRGLAIVGIIIHETCHVIMCIISGSQIEQIRLIERVNPKEGQKSHGYRGMVKLNENVKLTFLQAVLISLAPLYISFWFFFFLWDCLLIPELDVFYAFIIVFVMISILLYAAPSLADVQNIPIAFGDDPKYSLYQLLLLIISALTIYYFIFSWELVLAHEIFVYAFIICAYYGWKYLFRGINNVILYIRFLDFHKVRETVDPKALTRLSHKPLKPKKLGFKEAQF